MSECRIEGCQRERSVKASGLCQMHHLRLMRNGDPLIKRRARGVMDAPVVLLRTTKQDKSKQQERRRLRYQLEPRLIRLALALMRARGEVVERETLCAVTRIPPRSLATAIHELRYTLTYDGYDGYDAIVTHKQQGYAADMHLFAPRWKALRQERVSYWEQHGSQDQVQTAR